MEYVFNPRKGEFIQMHEDGDYYRLQVKCIENDSHRVSKRNYDRLNRSTFKPIKCNLCYGTFSIEGGILRG